MSAVEYQEVLEKAKQLSSDERRQLVAELSAAGPPAQSHELPAQAREDLDPVVRRIAEMNLPVSDVETMKREAQEGRWGASHG